MEHLLLGYVIYFFIRRNSYACIGRTKPAIFTLENYFDNLKALRNT